jgi:hypothetical protein
VQAHCFRPAPAGISSACQADRGDLQPGLYLLLLPVQGDALSGSRFRMADDLLELYLRQLIEAHGDSPEVVVAW